MSLAIVHSRAAVGIQAPEVCVEVHLSNGLPSLSIVGLPEAAVKESKDRVRGALLNARFDFPARRITINLAPADLPKEGARFDLAIAIGLLAASEQLPKQSLEGCEFIGELALSGELRPVRGVLPHALQARDAGRALILPQANAAEAALVSGLEIRPAEHLLDVCAHLHGQRSLAYQPDKPSSDDTNEQHEAPPDLSEVRGQQRARRALEISAAGEHSLLMIGPPGSGKTMLASRLPGILPSMSEGEALESAALASISGSGFNPRDWGRRPFRHPHHTASGVALVGGGSHPRPGEISLAHNGVLFLDELPEFERRVLEVLREPMESGYIVISRAARQAEFPARFQLVAAMNPCPCGWLGHASGRCHCSAEAVARYRARISGPLLDRIDIQLEVPSLPQAELLEHDGPAAESSAAVRARVERARERQLARNHGRANGLLGNRAIERYCTLGKGQRELLRRAVEQLGLSARAYHRIIKLARTIADLEGLAEIGDPQLAEAISYRRLQQG